MAYWRTLQVQPNSGLTFRWAEFLSKRQDVADVSMGPDGVNAGLQMLVYWEDLEIVVQQLLGYSYRYVRAYDTFTSMTNATPIVVTSTTAHGLVTGDVISISNVLGNTAANGTWTITRTSNTVFSLDGSTGNGAYTAGTGQFTQCSLRRVIPWRHPYWNQLWCTRISSVKGLQFTGKGFKPIPGRAIGAIESGKVSLFTLALLTLQFTRPPYPILTDDDISGDESRRYCDRFWEPSIQMMTREGGSFVYYGGPYTNGPAASADFVGSVGTPLPKMRLKRTWYQLPHLAIFDSNGYPANLVRYIGKVNSTEFQGIPAEVALLEAPQIEPRPLQIPAELMGILPEDRHVQLQYDVTFHISHFDPPMGIGVTASRGHNLMPWPGNTMFYPVQSKVNGPSGSPEKPFQSIDLAGLWKII